MKKCIRCGTEKHLNEFYAYARSRDGRRGECKTCTTNDVHKMKDRLKHNPEWVAQQRGRWRKARNKRYAAGSATPMSATYLSQWAKNNPAKYRAKNAANNAVKRGLLVKPVACERCQKQTRLEKHHPDYTRPLSVEWLCSTCHGLTRRKGFDPQSVSIGSRGGKPQALIEV